MADGYGRHGNGQPSADDVRGAETSPLQGKMSSSVLLSVTQGLSSLAQQSLSLRELSFSNDLVFFKKAFCVFVVSSLSSVRRLAESK